jgi:hypothetical protein
MKLLLACLCLLCAATFADEGPPPMPEGDKARFTVVAGSVDHGAGPVPTFIRMDTFTGKTWLLQQVPIPNGKGALVQVWIPNQEMGSEIYGAAVEAMKSK